MSAAEDRRSWHLDKAFSVQNLLQALIILGAVFQYMSSMEKRITVVEQASVSSSRQATELAQDQRLLRQEIRDDLKEIRSLLEQRARR